MMKRIKFTLVAIALLGIVTTAAAQQPAPGTTPRPAPGPLPKGKVAVINTALFQEQVGEFRARVEALNKQFETRVKDVQGLADRISALETTLKTNSQSLAAARVAELTEQLEGMKKDYQRKTEDLQADANRARDRAFEPVSAKLVKFAEDYTAKRGIVMLVDLANLGQSGTVLWVDPRIDVTKDFIAEYNKAYPVAAPAPAKP
jgi:outer membrane protein